MPLRTVLFISFATCLLLASSTSADGKQDPTDVIGKRFKLTMESKVEYLGVITQLNKQSVVLADVSVIGQTESGVPFLSNVPNASRLFKNVGLKVKELDYGIVVPLHEIKSWEAVETAAAGVSKNKPNAQMVSQHQIERWNHATRLKRITDRLFQDRDLSANERREFLKEIELLRKAISKD